MRKTDLWTSWAEELGEKVRVKAVEVCGSHSSQIYKEKCRLITLHLNVILFLAILRSRGSFQPGDKTTQLLSQYVDARRLPAEHNSLQEHH